MRQLPCCLSLLSAVTIGFKQTLYFTTEGVDSVVELCAIVMGSTMLERTAIVSFATRDGSATSIGGYGERTNQLV